MYFSQGVEKIDRIGKKTTKELNKLGINTFKDLLFYFPFRYEDFSEITKIRDLRSGVNANVMGTIEFIQNKRSPRRRMNITEALVTDETGSMKVIWFNQPFLIKNLKAGDFVSLAGKAREDYGGISIVSPVYEKIFSGKGIHTQGIIPVYHLTSGLTQKQIRFLIKKIIPAAKAIEDWLPLEIIKKLKLLNLNRAIEKIHFPENWNELSLAKRRLGFDELFLIQLQSEAIKKELESLRAEKILFKEKETKEFVDNLPFKLTDAQRKSTWEILKDMEKEKPMSRLVSGDVGSGKTIVAMIAMLNAALNKKQAVFMAPTEILAHQHFKSACNFFKKNKISIGLLSGSDKELRMSNKERKKEPKKKILEKMENGEIYIMIGTHALVQEDVKFKDLGLVVIDEQHRFGVEQRETLVKKSGNKETTPHLLSMTATPIPRSLALALFGDLDISIIDEMPKGRKKIVTQIISEDKREATYEFIRSQIKEGRQVFVICPLIDFSDKLGVKSVKDEYKKLKENIFPDFNLEILHGRLKAKEKEKVMNDFLENKINILVSTSVVEVGIDVPNATIMMIEGADRFGLAQLHQFRGRVGRGDFQSYCFLFTESDAPKTIKRLNSLTSFHSGFELARMDLKFRGPGEIFGKAQKGFPELKIANLFDYELMRLAKIEAKNILLNLDNYPKVEEKFRELKEKSVAHGE